METQEKWMRALHSAIAERGLTAVARQLGVSPSMISQAAKGVYKGNIARLQTLVEGSLLTETVSCPVLGDLAKHKCLQHQERPIAFATANPIKAQLYRACRAGCPYSKLLREY